ncbi:MAG: hypothetical protein QNK37_39035 [Acidobacteriota bacterium]|nr:hypothetical protein [Acidobacteriota bacterium]
MEPVTIDGIRYEQLKQDNLQGAITCVSHSFIQNEPMAAHLGITIDEFLHFAGAFYPTLIEPGLSFVAVDEEIDQVVGVRISEDFYDELEESPEIPGLSPKFFPLFTLLEELGAEYKKTHNWQHGKYIHMFMIAVEDGYQGRGIAPNMNKMFFRHVKGLGFTHAITEPTGLISQHILKNKFGFKVLHEIKYADFVFDGEKPFADLLEHPSAMLMEKDLSEIEV